MTRIASGIFFAAAKPATAALRRGVASSRGFHLAAAGVNFSAASTVKLSNGMSIDPGPQGQAPPLPVKVAPKFHRDRRGYSRFGGRKSRAGNFHQPLREKKSAIMLKFNDILIEKRFFYQKMRSSVVGYNRSIVDGGGVCLGGYTNPIDIFSR